MIVAYTFSGYTVPAPRRVLTADVIRIVGEYFGLTVGQLKSPCRARNIARPRQMIMWLARKHTKRTLPEIGDALGGRDHTTVLHGVRAIDRLRKEDPEIEADLRALERYMGAAA